MNIGNDPKKRLNMSIKPMLNIRPGSPDGRYTLVIQLILERRRGVLFTPYRLLPEEFDLRKRKAVAVNQRKTHVAHIRDVNAFLEKQREEIARILAEFERDGKPFTVHDITSAYRRRYDNRYVHTFFQHQIAELIKEGSQGTMRRWWLSRSSPAAAGSTSTTSTRTCCWISNGICIRFRCNPTRYPST